MCQHLFDYNFLTVINDFLMKFSVIGFVEHVERDGFSMISLVDKT